MNNKANYQEIQSIAQALVAAGQDVFPAETKYLLVDLFDTLITRSVHPEYVKEIWAKRLKSRFGLPQSSSELYALRRDLEALLCQEAATLGFDDEFYYPEFCQRYFELLRPTLPPSTSSLEFSSECEALELQIELSVQKIDYRSLIALQEYKDRGVRLVLVSDFYMPRRFIEALLQHHHASSLFCEVFVSCEEKISKRSGKLYQRVLQHFGIAPSAAAMLGDNMHADRDMALQQGLQALWLDKTELKNHYARLRQEHYQLDNSLLALAAPLRPTAERAQLFREFPYSLFVFIHHLHHRLRQAGVREVFFFSREGAFLQQLFEHYQGQLGSASQIRTHYLVVSRRSTFLPSLGPLETETFATLFRQYVDVSLFQFLTNFAFTREEIIACASSLGVDPFAVIENFPASQCFRQLRLLPKFATLYETKRTEQRAAFFAYLQSFGVDFANSGFHFVDIGWKGTMQDHLRAALPQEIKLHGYYLGLNFLLNTSESSKKEGILFSPLRADRASFKVYNEATCLFEILLGAPHGSAQSYQLTTNGAVAHTQTVPYEQSLYQQQIKPLHQFYERTFIEICRIFNGRHFDLEQVEEFFLKRHSRLVFFPTRAERKFFLQLKHWENFGLFNFTTFESKSIPWAQRLANLRAVLRAPLPTIQSATWPQFTLQQMGLSWLRPAYSCFRYYQLFGKRQGELISPLERTVFTGLRLVRRLLSNCKSLS